jgi:hypothetical protein
MNKVVDIMTEGYVHDMVGRNGVTKDTAHVEGVIRNMGRFDGHAFVMTALETHDEKRLTDGTGFNVWTGAGFWGIGAATRSTPMLLMGQEFGEPVAPGFRRSTLLNARFDGTSSYRPDGAALVDYYGAMIRERLRSENRSLRSPNSWFLRPRDNPDQPDPRIFAMAKWGDGSVLFVFHNLWEQAVAQTYTLPPELRSRLGIHDERSYQLVDVITDQKLGACIRGSELGATFYVQMAATTRSQWLRLEACPSS